MTRSSSPTSSNTAARSYESWAMSTGPTFAYSIGLYLNHLHPEIMVFGLSESQAKGTINRVCQLVSDGAVFGDGAVTEEVLESFPVSFLSVPKDQYRDHLGFALWFYRSLRPSASPCLQLVWPDKKGSFPWQEGFDPTLVSLQPLLRKAG